MPLEITEIPPVSKDFFERLVKTFPPLDVAGIKPSTDMIIIQRAAAQQEVIDYIRRAVPSSATIQSQPRKSLLTRITEGVLRK